LPLWTQQRVLLPCRAIKWCPLGWPLVYRCSNSEEFHRITGQAVLSFCSTAIRSLRCLSRWTQV
jgi:hypothetical protein